MKKFSIVLALVFFAVLALLVLMANLSILILLYFAVLGIATYLIYWWDKSAARKGNWRTPESTLHFLALGGGWPGALIAQQTLRHKTQKRSFRLIFWLTVIVNTAAFVWLFSQGYFSMFNSLVAG